MRTRRRPDQALLALAVAFGLTGGAAHAWAKGKSGAKPRRPAAPAAAQDPPASPADQTGDAPAASDDPPASSGKSSKPKVYNFSGLDLEGRLKTPQLLYFLNRVKVELDSTNNAKRSFLKELERSADDKGL